MKYFASFFALFLAHDVHASPYYLRSNTQALANSLKCAESIPKMWKNSGYLEVKNTYLTLPFYTKLYEAFDLFIEEFKQNIYLQLQLSQAEQNFRASDVGKFFCSVPLGAKDRTQYGEKDSRYYFQFTQKYAHMLKKTLPNLFLQNPILNDFFDKLEIVHQSCEHMFDQILHHLHGQDSVLDKAMRKEEKMAIVLKIVTYYGENNSGSLPHYDKSGLTLILDNDDEGPESFVFCPYRAQFESSKLAPVTRLYQKNTFQSSAVLIPGTLLKHLGSQIMPTPHAVRSFQKTVRHALIAFALTLDTDVSGVSSQIIHKRSVPEL
jgi:hypothetical protein